MFYVQFHLANGSVIGTNNGAAGEPTAGDGVGQLEFEGYVSTLGKIVDLQSLTLVDAPPYE